MLIVSEFFVECQWDENEVTSAMTDMHQENKVYVLLNVWTYYSSNVDELSKRFTGLSLIPSVTSFPALPRIHIIQCCEPGRRLHALLFQP